MPASEFVKFYTKKEAEAIGLNNPDHIIQLVFDEFTVGNSHVEQVIEKFSKDNVFEGILVGTQIKKGTDKVDICHKAKVGTTATQKTISIEVKDWESHKDHGDYLESCAPAGTTPAPTSKEVFGKVEATLDLTTKTVISKGILDAITTGFSIALNRRSGREVRGSMKRVSWGCRLVTDSVTCMRSREASSVSRSMSRVMRWVLVIMATGLRNWSKISRQRRVISSVRSIG